MKLLVNKIAHGRKYLVLFGCIRLPYDMQYIGDLHRLTVCGIPISYRIEEREGYKCAVLWGMRIRLGAVRKDRRLEHFYMRDTLTDEKIKALLVRILEQELHYHPDLVNPRTFNEKINWLKLHYHDPLITKCCDKYAVKDYVTGVIGEGYAVPTIAAWKRPEDIDLSALPDKFVLKVNWSSGYNIIVPDKKAFDPNKALKKLTAWMQPEANSYYYAFNWGYKHMKPVAYAEQYIEEMGGQVYDYKLFMVNGKFRFMFIATDRYKGETSLTYDFFDSDFKRYPFFYGKGGHAKAPLERPAHFNEMVTAAEMLAAPFPFVRVDFYEIGDRIMVGEMTFYTGGGMLPFDPPIWDWKLGDEIVLPEKRI